ncbi:hypothetical protein FJY90_07655, partial [Candidatus Gottesmanbacteria bacterium]|nr:hypothetical protein [Candidatus Gottesmanbacteria bacterium]
MLGDEIIKLDLPKRLPKGYSSQLTRLIQTGERPGLSPLFKTILDSLANPEEKLQAMDTVYRDHYALLTRGLALWDDGARLDEEALAAYLSVSSSIAEKKILCREYPYLVQRLLDYVYRKEGYLDWLKTFAAPEEKYLVLLQKELPESLREVFDRNRLLSSIWETLQDGLARAPVVAQPSGHQPTLKVRASLSVDIERSKSSGETYLHLEKVSFAPPWQTGREKKSISFNQHFDHDPVRQGFDDDSSIGFLVKVEHLVQTASIETEELSLSGLQVALMSETDRATVALEVEAGFRAVRQRQDQERARAKEVAANTTRRLRQANKIVRHNFVTGGVTFSDVLYHELIQNLQDPSVGDLFSEICRRVDLKIAKEDPGEKDLKKVLPSDIGPLIVYSEAKIAELVDSYIASKVNQFYLKLQDHVDMTLIPETPQGNLLTFMSSLVEGSEHIEIQDSPALIEPVVRQDLRTHVLLWESLIKKYGDEIREILQAAPPLEEPGYLINAYTEFQGIINWLLRRCSSKVDYLLLRPESFDPIFTTSGRIQNRPDYMAITSGSGDISRSGFDRNEILPLTDLRKLLDIIKSQLIPKHASDQELPSQFYKLGVQLESLLLTSYPRSAAERAWKEAAFIPEQHLEPLVGRYVVTKKAGNYTPVSIEGQAICPTVRARINSAQG